jgi:hypothetical protein
MQARGCDPLHHLLLDAPSVGCCRLRGKAKPQYCSSVLFLALEPGIHGRLHVQDQGYNDRRHSHNAKEAGPTMTPSLH